VAAAPEIQAAVSATVSKQGLPPTAIYPEEEKAAQPHKELGGEIGEGSRGCTAGASGRAGKSTRLGPNQATTTIVNNGKS
jgi:hypothetical protein